MLIQPTEITVLSLKVYSNGTVLSCIVQIGSTVQSCHIITHQSVWNNTEMEATRYKVQGTRYKVQGPGQGKVTSRNQTIAYKCMVAVKRGQYSYYSL